MIKSKNIFAFSFALLAGIVLFIPFLGGLHLFDWDEINFAESAREMIVSGNYLDVQINFMTFWEKPPLYIWLQVLSMKIFGINEFAARFPNAICGIISLYAIYLVGKKVRDYKFGWIWMITYMGSILPFFYFKSGIIDPWFNLFIFLGISFFSFYFIYPEKKLLRLALSALFIGLAILTKGPVALLVLIIVFTVFLVFRWRSIRTSLKDVTLFIGILSFTGGFWFILQLINGNIDIISDFIVYQIRLFKTHDAGHSGFFLYHFIILFFGVFPASIFALPSIFKKINGDEGFSKYVFWMKTLFWTVLILFTIVQTKIVHYSSLAYFPLTFIGGITIYDILEKRRSFGSGLRVTLFIVGALFSLLIIALVFFGIYKEEILSGGIKLDEFTRANLAANVHWSGIEMLIGIVFLFMLVFSLFILRNNRTSLIVLVISTVIFVYSTIIFITPKIEAYSQRAAIEFFKSLKDENVYVATLGYKSYANLFYSEVNPERDIRATDSQWLLEGSPDRDVYFVFKINKKDKYFTQYPELQFLGEKNGFVFAIRKFKND